MPKGTEEEKETRKQAIANAGVVEATAHMENAKICRRVYDMGVKYRRKDKLMD